jgi:hypothetical protein
MVCLLPFLGWHTAAAHSMFNLPETAVPPHPPPLFLQVGTISEAYPHLIFDRFTSRLGQRAASILKHLFPPPKLDAKRVITFANQVRMGPGSPNSYQNACIVVCWFQSFMVESFANTL